MFVLRGDMIREGGRKEGRKGGQEDGREGERKEGREGSLERRGNNNISMISCKIRGN